MTRKPSLRSRFSAPVAADPGSRGLLMRVSKAATATFEEPFWSVPSHSRSPIPADTSPPSACWAADCRVPGRLNPNAWVGPPTTSSSTSPPMTVGAAPTSTCSTRRCPASPSATASATILVLPNIDSKTTRAAIILTCTCGSGARTVDLSTGGDRDDQHDDVLVLELRPHQVPAVVRILLVGLRPNAGDRQVGAGDRQVLGTECGEVVLVDDQLGGQREISTEGAVIT